MGILVFLIWETCCFQLGRLELSSLTRRELLISMAFKVTQSLHLAPKLLEKGRLCLRVSLGAQTP